MPFLRLFAVSLFVLTTLIGCKAKPFQPVQAPDFSLKDLSGKTVTLSSLRGHPVMLDFWATWCGPCQISIPLVQHFYQAHKDQGLMVIGVNVDEDPSGVYPFVKHFKISYPVVHAGGTSVPEDYHVEGIPLFIFINKEGRIVKRFDGFRPDMAEDWEFEFQQLTTTK